MLILMLKIHCMEVIVTIQAFVKCENMLVVYAKKTF